MMSQVFSPAGARGIRLRSRIRPLLPILVAAGAIAGCATASGPERNVDPLEAINRPIYRFNELTDRFLVRPVAKGYDFVMPRPARTGVSNFLDNLRYPVVIINGFLQGKFNQGIADTGRLLINSTIGIAGLFDPATGLGLEAHEEDFGLTLARWGVAEGPYIMVPLIGPRTFRSGAGTLADIQVNPIVAMNNSSARGKIVGLWVIDTRAGLLPIDKQIEEAFDPYLFVRDAYLQNRKFLREGQSARPEDPFEDELDADF
jgi:phospholipid-binding lipoprotein MlaA